MDMDFSPEFGNLSDRNNPPSDHPTPSTLNSSSNTSYSLTGADDPSPGTKQQKSSSNYPSQESSISFDKLNSIPMPPGGLNPQAAGMNPMGGRFYSSTSGGPSMTTEASNTFSMASAWDLPNQTPAMNNADLGALNMESFSESQWAQILGSQILTEHGTNAGWEHWPPS
jgi:hypothetical protein